MKHTAVLAAAVAAASLAVTGWGTYKSAQVADDQLSQSREQDEAEKRAQAVKVTVWTEPGMIVIANRSLDPVHAYLHATVGPESASLAILPAGIVPPCRRVDIPMGTAPKKLFNATIRADMKLTPERFTFVDAAGTMWERQGWGELVQVDNPETSAIAKGYGNNGVSYLPTDDLVSLKEVKLTALEECGVAGG
ncbi:hypothetical protein [Streptomyces rubiginosohelvolus]